MGFYYFRNRFYDAVHGRFVQRDPMGAFYDRRNLGNAYGMVGANAVNGMDPLGLGELDYQTCRKEDGGDGSVQVFWKSEEGSTLIGEVREGDLPGVIRVITGWNSATENFNYTPIPLILVLLTAREGGPAFGDWVRWTHDVKGHKGTMDVTGGVDANGRSLASTPVVEDGHARKKTAEDQVVTLAGIVIFETFTAYGGRLLHLLEGVADAAATARRSKIYGSGQGRGRLVFKWIDKATVAGDTGCGYQAIATDYFLRTGQAVRVMPEAASQVSSEAALLRWAGRSVDDCVATRYFTKADLGLEEGQTALVLCDRANDSGHVLSATVVNGRLRVFDRGWDITEELGGFLSSEGFTRYRAYVTGTLKK